MLAQPSLIKRPVVEWAGVGVSVDFDAAAWASEKERFTESLRSAEARRMQVALVEKLRKVATIKLNDQLASNNAPRPRV